MIDIIEDPSALVLKFLDENLLKISAQKPLEGSDLRHVARNILKPLAALHENGFVHTGNIAPRSFQDITSNHYDGTDVKPDNVLVNYEYDLARFSEVQLSDCDEVYRFDPKADPFDEGHIIGAAIFRSPEAMLNLRWGPPTDIWSWGTTVCS